MRLSEAEAKKILGKRLPRAKTPRGKADLRRVNPYDPYDSKTDQTWAKVGSIVLQAELGKRIAVVRYHPIIFVLVGETYKIDFLMITEDGLHYFIECKGTDKARNYRDARSKLRAAAELHPYWTFMQATWPDQKNELGWKVEKI